MRWTLSENTTCNDGDDFVIGSKLVNLSVNGPCEAQLNTWTVPGAGHWGAGGVFVNGGTFFVCAIVEPEDNVVETSNVDNSVRSERTFHVRNLGLCPPWP